LQKRKEKKKNNVAVHEKLDNVNERMFTCICVKVNQYLFYIYRAKPGAKKPLAQKLKNKRVGKARRKQMKSRNK